MKNLALYIHWPFCEKKCPYCDFNSHEDRNYDQELWLKAYILELEVLKMNIRNKCITSIFFGGGTPSLMNPKIVKDLLFYIKNNFTLHNNIEITLEANPSSVEIDKFYHLKEAGINRISIGVQSLSDEELKFLGRLHDSSLAVKAIEIAKLIFDRYSFDLIYGLPNQDINAWLYSLENIINKEYIKNHLSLYQLTIEKGTKFYQDYIKKKLIMPNEEILLEFYKKTNQLLQKYDILPYEISNYSREKDISLHNMSYWKYDEYIGIGPGAHSRIHINNEVYNRVNYHNPQVWLNAILTNISPSQIYNKLSLTEIIDEILLSGLRLYDGINYNNYNNLLGGENLINFINQNKLYYLIEHNIIKFDDTSISIAEDHILIANNIIGELMSISV